MVWQPPEGLKALEAVWRYVVSVTPWERPEEVRALLVARLPAEGQRWVMSWGQILEQRGREQGREEGLQQGRHEGQARTLLAQMRVKFGAVPQTIEARVRQGTEEELERWTQRILTVDSIEALFV